MQLLRRRHDIRDLICGIDERHNASRDAGFYQPLLGFLCSLGLP